MNYPILNSEFISEHLDMRTACFLTSDSYGYIRKHSNAPYIIKYETVDKIKSHIPSCHEVTH